MGLLREDVFPDTRDCVVIGGCGSVSSTSYVTILDISGKGILNSLAGVPTGTTSITSVTAKLTIDGVVVYENLLNYLKDNIPVIPFFAFESGLKIEIKGSTAHNSRTHYVYVLD